MPKSTTFRARALAVLAAALILAAGPSAPGAEARIAARSGPEVFLTTSDLSDAMRRMPNLRFSSSPPAAGRLIVVDAGARYQRFGGIGVAMTDSSAWLLYDELPASTRARVMKDLFGPEGIHLSFLRVPMGASDFTVGGRPYSYDEVRRGRSDPRLARFSIAHDKPYIIPILRQALRVNRRIEVEANPWTAPSWMKANDSFSNIGGRGSLLPSAYGPMADYFMRFITAYERRGIPIDAITPANEPSSGGRGTRYPGITLPERAEARLVAQNLRPALSAAGIRTKIYGEDLSWDRLSYASALAAGPAAADLAGISWHCYFGSPTVMSQFHRAHPAMDQIVNECSPEIRPLATPEFLISSLRNWASSVALWNVALDPYGGPVQPPNTGCPGCDGVVTISERAGTATFSKKYFQLGQVSRFVQPDAVRIDSRSFVRYGVNALNMAVASPGLDDVAFLNPDGTKVLIAYDNSTSSVSLAVETRGRYFAYRLTPWTMASFVWDRPGG